MSYRVISGEVKVEIVLKMFRGFSPTKMEKEYCIPKKTMYEWKAKAIEILHRSFEHTPPGPKRKPKDQLLNSGNLSQDLDQDQNACPNCDSGKLWKNGDYKLVSGKVKQRLICKVCQFQVSTEKKTT